ncbi:hypothetical protein QBC44DRAFT_127519 [Cladorrhinum sp. PSN332]|nr:hypothetical protein QBC44DRAFT_127519 [Cladorrhinum sp. PSN332]
MNFPFGASGPNMDRFNFLRRGAANPPQPPQPPPGPHPATIENYNPYAFDDDAAHSDDDDDRAPLSPRGPYYASNSNPEMSERPSAGAHQPQQSRFSRLSSYLRPGGGHAGFRPSSSNYSGHGLHGAPAETVIGGGPAGRRLGRNVEVLESPKTPDFRIGAQDLPSTRLHLPNLDRTWTLGSNGPPSREGPTPQAIIQEPAPAIVAGVGESERRRERRERRERRHRREGSGGSSGSRSRRHRRDGSGGSGGSSGRRGERRRRRHAAEGGTDTTATTTTSSGSGSSRSSSRRGPPPKHFLFCFPWIKSRRIRSQILKCFVSGVFLASILTVYLSLALTKNIKSSEFTILLILIILAITIFFCHSLIRLCMLVVKGRSSNNNNNSNRRGDLESGQQQQQQRNGLPEMQPPAVFGGYAMPRQPIRVVLASDEEAAGIESAATKLSPPAYGLWRESVRVDPNRFYWQRNGDESSEESLNNTTASSSSLSSSSSGAAGGQSGRAMNAPRPPSYSSDDGVSYVVEARPRSTLPPPPGPHAAGLHPGAEVGRGAVGQPSPW